MYNVSIAQENYTIKNNKKDNKLILWLIAIFASFSILNIFLIFNFINILGNIQII